jgi:hypothetical protein
LILIFSLSMSTPESTIRSEQQTMILIDGMNDLQGDAMKKSCVGSMISSHSRTLGNASNPRTHSASTLFSQLVNPMGSNYPHNKQTWGKSTHDVTQGYHQLNCTSLPV